METPGPLPPWKGFTKRQLIYALITDTLISILFIGISVKIASIYYNFREDIVKFLAVYFLSLIISLYPKALLKRYIINQIL